MDKYVHFKIAKYVLENAPQKLRNFVEPMTNDEIGFYCWVSDEIDRDSFISGYWWHSWKLREVESKGKKILEWVRGSLPGAISALYWDCRNKYREGNFVVCRQNLIKMSHYTIDSCTMPHVVEKKADVMHEKFEKDLAKTIDNTLHQIKLITPLPEIEVHPFPIYELAKERCEETYRKYKSKLIAMYNQGGTINDIGKASLRKQIIKDCCDWTLTALWATYDYMMFPSIAE